MKGGGHPSPFPALSLPDLNKVPIHCWADEEGCPVVGRRNPITISRPSSDILHHKQAFLTTRLWGLSLYLYSQKQEPMILSYITPTKSQIILFKQYYISDKKLNLFVSKEYGNKFRMSNCVIFVFAAPPKMSKHLNKRICSPWGKFFPLRVDFILLG